MPWEAGKTFPLRRQWLILLGGRRDPRGRCRLVNGDRPVPVWQPGAARPALEEELRLTPQEFNRKFKRSPMLRARRRGYLRNVAVALGNSQDDRAVPALASCLENEPEALVRAHAAWALGRYSGAAPRAALQKAVEKETEPSVLAEIQAALSG